MGKERARGSGPGAGVYDERRMERLLDATAALAQTLGADTLDPIAKAAVRQAQRLVEARIVLLCLEERGHLVVAGATGEVAPTAAAMREPADGAAWRRVMSEGKPERVSKVSGRLAAALAGSGIQATSALLVPLTVRGRSIGVLACFDRVDGPRFAQADQEILTGFAASAAMAVAPMRSIAEARLRDSIEVAERERARWARELHDETLQSLGALRVRLAASLRQSRPEQMDAAVREAVAHIEDEIANLRSLITELRPAALDELGLGAAIESLAENHSAVTELDVNLDVALADEDGVAPRRLERELESTVYRVIQEALTNVAKHADADRVWIEVAEDSDSLLIVVRDDGTGFDMNDRGQGFGLVGIRERIALQGGSLAIVSSPGAGTELRGRIPLDGDRDGDRYSVSSMPRSSA
jgi:signal transduction histidine kinase